MGQRISFGLSRASAVMLLIMAICSLVDIEKQKDTSEKCGTMIIALFGAIIYYFICKFEEKEHRKIRMSAVEKFIEEPDINISVVQKLIEEIEKYNKKVKVFASWIAGLAATFLILLITVFTNYIYKVLDILAEIIPENELLEGFEREFMDNRFFVQMVENSLGILLLLCMVILIIYFTFSIFTFVKEQILIFLYDVQYKMLLKVSEGHADMEIHDAGEKQNESGE